VGCEPGSGFLDYIALELGLGHCPSLFDCNKYLQDALIQHCDNFLRLFQSRSAEQVEPQDDIV
jgi:hypothetical protein